MMKNFFILSIFILFFLNGCTNTSHVTLYSFKDFDKEHFTVNTQNRGDFKNGDVNAKLLLFYFPLTRETLGGNKLEISINEAFGYSNSNIFVDTEFEYFFAGDIFPFCIYCQTDVTVSGYESKN